VHLHLAAHAVLQLCVDLCPRCGARVVQIQVLPEVEEEVDVAGCAGVGLDTGRVARARGLVVEEDVVHRLHLHVVALAVHRVVGLELRPPHHVVRQKRVVQGQRARAVVQAEGVIGPVGVKLGIAQRLGHQRPLDGHVLVLDDAEDLVTAPRE